MQGNYYKAKKEIPPEPEQIFSLDEILRRVMTQCLISRAHLQTGVNKCRCQTNWRERLHILQS